MRTVFQLASFVGGDPYRDQIEKTVNWFWNAGVGNALIHFVTRVRWGRANGFSRPCTTPSIGLLMKKVRNVLVIPIAFVSDHVETLSEIEHEAREEAIHHGILQFEMMPGLNDSPEFIRR